MEEIRTGAVRTSRHESAFLEAGPADGPLMVFVHGWPELSHSWRGQLPVFGGLGFRALAPDMRGYGRSSAPRSTSAYALREIVADLVELLDGVGAERAVLVGHDWGAPAVWSLAQRHPERCLALANLCVPYIPGGFTPANVIPLSNRAIYPEAEHPAAQWDYQLFYEENFEAATRAFEADVRATVRALFRAGDPAGRGAPAVTAGVRARGGWFGSGLGPPLLPRDERVIRAEDEEVYVEALSRTGFFGADSWYMNAADNAAFARESPAEIRTPALFLHAAYDAVCDTLTSRLAEPMRAACPDLEEVVVASGHWMAQERPREVNAALAAFLARKLPALFTPKPPVDRAS